MIRRLRCEGAPRDLGLDQGRACAAEVRRALDAASGGRWAGGGLLGAIRRRLPGAAPSAGERLWTALRRHLPHGAEALEGLALGARVPLPALVEEIARATWRAGAVPEFRIELGAGEAAPARITSGPLGPAEGWRLRETRPESGYPCLALTRTWLPGAFAGVNAEGLAAAWEPRSDAVGRREALAGFGPFLLEQCLERFDTVEKCLEWCERRPGGGAGRLLFVDAGRAAGGIERGAGRARRVRAPRPLPKGAGSDGEGGSEALHVQIDPGQRVLEVCEGDRVAREALDG